MQAGYSNGSTARLLSHTPRAFSDDIEDSEELDLVTGGFSEDEPSAPVSAVSSPRRSTGPASLTLQQRSSIPRPQPPFSTPGLQSSRIEVVLESSPRQRHSPLGPGASYSDGRVTSGSVPGSRAPRQKTTSTVARQESPVRPAPVATLSAPATADGAPKKARGRPKGWRPGLSYSGKPLTPAEAAERIERARLAKLNAKLKTPAKAKAKAKDKDKYKDKQVADGTAKTVKKRGRPYKVVPSARSLFLSLSAQFIPFGCEWQGCKAELQNMATLRRHVLVVHGRAEACLWGKCAREVGGTPVLATQADFEEHVERTHLLPYQWHMGDGYRNSIVAPKYDADKLPRYLFDANGKQVTPSVQDQELEDFATYQANRRRLRELLVLRDANAPLEDDANEGDGLGGEG